MQFYKDGFYPGDPAALGRHLATILTTEEDSHERRHIDHDQY